jgi:cellulose synthase/poly-beta-1,6-N-acetylglucosamine synthase-like glycosyltransferase
MVYNFICIIVVLVAIPAVGASLYLLILTLLSGKPKNPPPSSRRMRFDIIVPAHNEEAVIVAAVRSLLAVDWPADRFRVVVVADNCTDSTAEIASAAGAHVLSRFDPERRGKGYALDFAFAASRAEGRADALLVVDADAKVSRNILEACACRMERGAKAVQVHYGVSNTNASWRTRLLSIAKASFHIVRSRGRERLGLSCGIRGNGWSVTHDLLEQVPYKAFSLTEDLEYGIDLGTAGFRVAYADEAHSDAEMVSGEKDSRKQRQRWEQGRFQLVRSRTWPLLRQAVREPSRICLDLALDLMVLPVSYVFLNIAILLGLTFWLASMRPQSAPWLSVGVLCALSLILYILRGWQLSGAGLRGLLDLGRAPFFLAWKLMVMLKGGGSKEWVRTKREGS